MRLVFLFDFDLAFVVALFNLGAFFGFSAMLVMLLSLNGVLQNQASRILAMGMLVYIGQSTIGQI